MVCLGIVPVSLGTLLLTPFEGSAVFELILSGSVGVLPPRARPLYPPVEFYLSLFCYYLDYYLCLR